MHIQKTNLLIGLLLTAFFIKGLVFAAILPIFQGPDEQLHYAAVQQHTYPIISTIPGLSRDNTMYAFHVPEETASTAKKTQLYEIRWDPTKTQRFSETSEGISEEEIRDNTWVRSLPKDIPSDIPPFPSLYYKTGTIIERLLSNQDIFVRLFSLRILSVFLGAVIIFLSYCITRNIGFSKRASLLFAAIIAFQPMLSTTAAIVNPDILLIFAFTLYTYAAASLLKDRMRPTHLFLLGISIVLGIVTKGPGAVLVITSYPLLVFLGYRHFTLSVKAYAARVLATSVLAAILIFIITPSSYLTIITNASATSKFPSLAVSLEQYASETLNQERTFITVASYWGHFGWLDARLPEGLIDIILIVELLIFAIAIPAFLFQKKYPEHLPKKHFVFFLFGMVIALQIAIRFYDWRVFDPTGEIRIGTPGRYFLPNITAHIILLAVGIGSVLRNQRSFETLLKVMLILMVTLNLYSVFHILIPRYYI